MKKELLQKSAAPVVCAVGTEYVICIFMKKPALVSVWIDGTEYASADNGVRVSAPGMHRIRVPMAALDKAKGYTVRIRPMVERLSYHPLTLPEAGLDFPFFPVPQTGAVKIYHLSDTHGETAAAIEAGKFFSDGAPELLILNGDISPSSKNEADVLRLFEIAFGVTGGSRPVIITRGNHDCRGLYADRLGAYYPTDGGNFYYTVRLGALWFLVLDCGEDKTDDHAEYGNTACFHAYRLQETAFLRRVIDSAAAEYLAPGVRFRAVISHIPFMHTDFDPQKGVHEFDIEQPIYTEWCSLIREHIAPQFGLFGHIHRTQLYEAGGPYDNKRFGSPMILGGKPDHEQHDVVGAAIELSDAGLAVRFTNKDKHVLSEAALTF